MSKETKVFLICMMTMYIRGVELAVSTKDEQIIVSEHNKIRTEVNPTAANMQKMHWSDDLAAGAQAWADQCTFSHNSMDDRDQGWGVDIGQNWQAYWSSAPNATSKDWYWVVEQWESEKADWTYGVNVDGVGHYVQLISADTALVGCGYAQCPDNGITKHYYMCDYAPTRGSIMAPYEEGPSCAACPLGTCSNNLCDCGDLIVCQNGGVLDLSTCTCTCPTYYTGDFCQTRDCTEAGENTWCATKNNHCSERSTTWAMEHCAITCGYCPDL